MAHESVLNQVGDTPWQIVNLALFSNVQSSAYWSGTEYAFSGVWRRWPPTALFFWAGLMARYEHLPTYNAALDMTAYFERLVADLSRDHKYTMDTKLREGCRAVLQPVLHANNAATRNAAAGLERRDGGGEGGGEGVCVGADGAHGGLTLA